MEKNYFNSTKIFVLRLFKMVTNQTECSRLQQCSVMHFFVVTNYKSQMKFTDECVICTQEHILFKKVTNRLNMSLLLRVEKTVDGIEKQLTLRWRKSSGRSGQRKSDYNSVLGHKTKKKKKKKITINFLEKGAAIYSVSYYQLFRQNSPHVLNYPRIRVECSPMVQETWVRVIPKNLKMVLDISLLNTQQYKVRIKSKVELSRERSSALPYTLV